MGACCEACTSEYAWEDVDTKGFDVLTIPRYVNMEGDEVAECYAREREMIKKIYKGKDLVEVTLKKLTS